MKLSYAFILIAGFFLMGEAPPPREIGIDITSTQSAQNLGACIKERFKRANERELPGAGVSVQVGEGWTIFAHIHPYLYFDITDADGARHIVVRYSHLISKGEASQNIRMVGRKCFRQELDAAGGGLTQVDRGQLLTRAI